MPNCENCGKNFDVDEARSEFDADDEWAGELTYDDAFPEHSVCCSCAVADTVETLERVVACSSASKQGCPQRMCPKIGALRASERFLMAPKSLTTPIRRSIVRSIRSPRSVVCVKASRSACSGRQSTLRVALCTCWKGSQRAAGRHLRVGANASSRWLHRPLRRSETYAISASGQRQAIRCSRARRQASLCLERK
jgi:hypothetical protein